MVAMKDMMGRKVNRLLVTKLSHKTKNDIYWEAICNCGEKVIVGGKSIRRGKIKSCGCLRQENRIKHNGSHRPEYYIWSSMKYRCQNPKDKRFLSYGGRGIQVCTKWKQSFQTFFEDMGPRPSKDYSINRIDNDGDYTPSNCEWATSREQSRNTIKTRIISYQGKTQCLKDWAKELSLNYDTTISRLNVGYSVKEAFTKQRYERRK